MAIGPMAKGTKIKYSLKTLLGVMLGLALVIAYVIEMRQRVFLERQLVEVQRYNGYKPGISIDKISTIPVTDVVTNHGYKWRVYCPSKFRFRVVIRLCNLDGTGEQFQTFDYSELFFNKEPPSDSRGVKSFLLQIESDSPEVSVMTEYSGRTRKLDPIPDSIAVKSGYVDTAGYSLADSSPVNKKHILLRSYINGSSGSPIEVVTIWIEPEFEAR